MNYGTLMEEPLLRYLVYFAFLILLLAATCILVLTIHYIRYEEPEPLHIYHWMPADPIVKTSDIVDLRVNASATSDSVDENMLYKVPRVDAIPLKMFPAMPSHSDPILPESNRQTHQPQMAV